MKNDSLISALIGALALSALASVVLCLIYVSTTRELRSLQGQLVGINNRRASVNALVNETVEYSKTHPAIDPVLEASGIKRNPPPAGTRPANR